MIDKKRKDNQRRSTTTSSPPQKKKKKNPLSLQQQSLYSGSNVILATEETYYESTPRIDEVGCAAYKADDESQQLLEAPLLPDLSAVVDEETREPVWVFKGEERVAVASAGGDGTVLAGLWEARARHGERETVYRFWASGGQGSSGEGGAAAVAGAATTASASASSQPLPPLLRPLRLHQQGPDMLSGSHFDEYVVDYGELVPGPPPAASFEKPQSCVGVEVDEGKEESGPRRRLSSARLAATAASVAPRLPCGSSDRRRKASPSSSSSSSSSSLLSSSSSSSALEENAAFVAAHNSGARDGSLLSSASAAAASAAASSPSSLPPSYRVELNRFAALSDAEFASTYLQGESLAARRQRRRNEEQEEKEEENEDEENKGKLQSSSKNNKNKNKTKKKPFSAELPYSRKVPKDRVPSAVDWRGTGAVPQAVKDQSTCGSCWAFGTAAAVEGASFLSSGKAFSVSEQQFMDCSWNFGANSACGGGDADAALDWLVKERRGEFQVEGEYQYIGAAGFCQKPQQGEEGARRQQQPQQRGGDDSESDDDDDNSSSSSLNSSSSSPPLPRSPATTRVAGYAFVPAGDDEALKEAVYSRGPLQVSIDAAAKGFRFYSSGVYDEPSCSPKEEDLDHSVALVGYGTDEVSGKDYWLVRNSW